LRIAQLNEHINLTVYRAFLKMDNYFKNMQYQAFIKLKAG